MKLVILSTGSRGNNYLLQSSNGKFCVLDCGIKFQDITNNENFNGFRNLDFVFCSHIHEDHSKSLEDFKNSGCEIISYENPQLNKTIEFGQWKVRMFKIKHNVENYGIIIHDTNENKTMCYVTDFTEMPKIENVDYWLYEINYDEFTVDKIIDNKDISKLHVTNNIQYHNSLENAVDYFSNLSNTPKLIVACHLSNMGGTRELIAKKMQPLCDRIEIAKKNLIVEF